MISFPLLVSSSRIRRLLILPTLVLGISGTILICRGIAHLVMWPRSTNPCRYVAMACGSRSSPSLQTTRARGRSPHCSSGIPTTATDLTAACELMRLSSSSVLIHSPPVLITSLMRSLISTIPWGSIEAMSPVCSQLPFHSSAPFSSSFR